MTLSFISVEATTGRIIADLPDLETQGTLAQTMMRYEAATVTVPYDTAPRNWRTATRPGAVFIIALDDDQSTPLWGGLVLTRQAPHQGEITLSLATGEAYMDRRYVGDHTFTQRPQNSLVQDLVTAHLAAGALPGLPCRVQVVGGTGTPRDRTYADTDDKTLYSVLQDLSGVQGGPEWTLGWERSGDNLYTPVLYVGDRIGADVPAGLGPDAVFNMPGPATAAQVVESYDSRAGANDVMATSTGLSGARPQSPRQRADYNGRPTFEYRWTPSTSITDVATLTGHAARALAAMGEGSTALTITAARAEAPRLGTDWLLGDTIGFDLTSPAWPDGLTGTARAIGWQLNNNTITPILDASTIGGL